MEYQLNDCTVDFNEYGWDPSYLEEVRVKLDNDTIEPYEAPQVLYSITEDAGKDLVYLRQAVEGAIDNWKDCPCSSRDMYEGMKDGIMKAFDRVAEIIRLRNDMTGALADWMATHDNTYQPDMPKVMCPVPGVIDVPKARQPDPSMISHPSEFIS